MVFPQNPATTNIKKRHLSPMEPLGVVPGAPVQPPVSPIQQALTHGPGPRSESGFVPWDYDKNDEQRAYSDAYEREKGIWEAEKNWRASEEKRLNSPGTPMPTRPPWGVKGMSTPRGLTGDVPTDMPPGRPSAADFPRYQPASPAMPGTANFDAVSPAMGIADLRPLGVPPAMANDFNSDPATRDISRRTAPTLPGELQGPLPRSAYEQGGDKNAAYGDMVSLAGALRGQQRYDDSDIARMQGGRMADMTANRNMGQMAGGNYADMQPAEAMAASQRMYRGGGLGGASMAAREDSLEQALRSKPSGSSYGQRIAGSRQEMDSMLAEALQGQGREMNPQAGFEQNARSLEAGTTLRGTSADGTPIMVSRGSAGTLDDRTKSDRQDQYRTARREKAAGLKEYRQNQNAMRNEAMREAASNPMNSPIMQALAMNNPHGAAAMMREHGNMKLGNAELAQRAEAAKNQQLNEITKLEQSGMLTKSQADEAAANVRRLDAETDTITAAGTPEAQKAALKNSLIQGMAESGNLPPLAAQGIANEVSNMFGNGQSGGAIMPPLSPPIGSDEVTDAQLDERVEQLEQYGLTSDKIKAELAAYGIPEERIGKYVERKGKGWLERTLEAIGNPFDHRIRRD
jgi:hypothetical protein